MTERGENVTPRRTPLESVHDALALQKFNDEGATTDCGMGTVDALLDLVLRATTDELAAIRAVVLLDTKPMPARLEKVPESGPYDV